MTAPIVHHRIDVTNLAKLRPDTQRILQQLTSAGPSPIPPDKPKPTVWVVQQVSGGRLRVLAEWHTTYARPDGTELRFYNQSGDDRHRVATVRAGSWHWCVAETSLEPKADQS